MRTWIPMSTETAATVLEPAVPVRWADRAPARVWRWLRAHLRARRAPAPGALPVVDALPAAHR